jgi:hypothetical protein
LGRARTATEAMKQWHRGHPVLFHPDYDRRLRSHTKEQR